MHVKRLHKNILELLLTLLFENKIILIQITARKNNQLFALCIRAPTDLADWLA
jgi:hypothetical protein